MIFDEIDQRTEDLYRKYLIQTLIMCGVQPKEEISNQELLEWAAQFPGASDWSRFMQWGAALGHTIFPRPMRFTMPVKPIIGGKIKFRDYRERTEQMHMALTQRTVKKE